MDGLEEFTAILSDIGQNPANGSLAALYVSLGASQARLWSDRASFFNLVKGVHTDPIAQQIHAMLINNIDPETFDKAAKILLETGGATIHDSTKNVRSSPLTEAEVSMGLFDDEHMGDKRVARILPLETAILLFVLADQLHFALCEDGPTDNLTQTYGMLPPRTGVYDSLDVKMRAVAYNWYHLAQTQRAAANLQKAKPPSSTPNLTAAKSLITELSLRSLRHTKNEFETNLIEMSFALLLLKAPARPGENRLSRLIARMSVYNAFFSSHF